MLTTDIDAMSDDDARNTLDALCVEKFGPRWKTAFAEFSGITKRAVHVWMADTRPPVWSIQLMDADSRANDMARRLESLDLAIAEIQKAKRNF